MKLLPRLLTSLLVWSCSGTIEGGVRPEIFIPGTTCKLTPLPTQLVRLTHQQYDNTVADLLGVADAKAAGFLPDPSFAGFNNSAEGMVVADRLGRDYRRAAEELATKVITTPSARSTVTPCATNTPQCVDQFIDTFGRRAFRRPLTPAEHAAYATLFAKGPMLVDAADAFSAGLSLTIEAMLQSPHFLYRTEVDLLTIDGTRRLNPYEVAAKLAFVVWNSMPDDVLLDAAGRGALGTKGEVEAQVLRMLDDPKAQRAIDDFHAQWLELERYKTIVRDPARFPAFTTTLPASMQEETTRFLRAVVLDDKRPFADLYTANFTFVNQELARVYGLSGVTGTGFSRVTLDSRRKGLLTQSGILASHSYSRTDSPIHRGVFVMRRIVGQPPPDPPPGVDFTLPPLMGTVRTTRDQVTLKTSPRDCNGCHATINQPGFGFGHFDALGQWRDQENGVDVDSSGSIALGDSTASFSSATELIDAIAKSAEARRSYATNWFRYASQRADERDDHCELERMTEGLTNPTRPVREILVDLAQLPSFSMREPEAP